MKLINIKRQLIYVFTSLLLLYSCSDKNINEESNKNKSYCIDEGFKTEIEISQPTLELMTNEVHLSGIVEPNPENVVQFSNLVNGIIVSTSFSLGDYVKKGQTLAEVRSTELSEWKAKQKILASQLETAKHELESIQSMYDDGISSKNELYKAKSEIISIESELEEINSNLELYNANTKNNVFLIKAPRSGFVTEKNIYSGMQVEAYGSSLFTISELSDVWVQINIYDSDLHKVSEGMEVSIQSLSYPDSIFTGNIDAISYVLDKESRVIKARVSIENKNLLLKPGMFVDVMAKQKTDLEVLGIPLSALIYDDNKNFVILYKSDCNIVAKPIELIGQTNGTCYISKDNLNPVDKIITKNQLLIYEQIKNFQN